MLNLLKDLQLEFGLTYLFISHDLSVVKFMSDMMAVMNHGKIVEFGPSESIYEAPKEDYTRRLIESIPQDSLQQIEKRQRERLAAQGEELPEPKSAATGSEAAADKLEKGSEGDGDAVSGSALGTLQDASEADQPGYESIPGVLKDRAGMSLGPFGEVIDPDDELPRSEVPSLDSFLKVEDETDAAPLLGEALDEDTFLEPAEEVPPAAPRVEEADTLEAPVLKRK